MHKTLTLQRVLDAAQADDGSGICTDCGADQQGCEPDARGLECDVCGARAVYGAEELLLICG